MSWQHFSVFFPSVRSSCYSNWNQRVLIFAFLLIFSFFFALHTGKGNRRGMSLWLESKLSLMKSGRVSVHLAQGDMEGKQGKLIRFMERKRQKEILFLMSHFICKCSSHFRCRKLRYHKTIIQFGFVTQVPCEMQVFLFSRTNLIILSRQRNSMQASVIQIPSHVQVSNIPVTSIPRRSPTSLPTSLQHP